MTLDDTNSIPNNAHVAAIAAAYLGNPSNTIDKGDLADVIRHISAALNSQPESPVTSDVAATPAEPQFQKPTAAAIRKTITPAHLISLIDGRPYKSLKRHLASNGHTPKSYREQFGLKSEYPMTAPAYSAQRSELAKKLGLGQLRAKRQAEALAIAAAGSAPGIVEPVKTPKAKPGVAQPAAPAEPTEVVAAAAAKPKTPRKPKSAPTPAAITVTSDPSAKASRKPRAAKVEVAASPGEPVATDAAQPVVKMTKPKVTAKTPRAKAPPKS